MKVMFHRLVPGLFALACTFAVAIPALAQKRVALTIGNQGYNERVGPLRNPHNDILLVGSALREVGFELLNPVKEGSRDDMLEAVHDLATRLRRAGTGAIGFLYYTGHGVAVGGENVLVPVNAADTTDRTLTVRGVRVGEVLDILKRDAPDAVMFVVIDACRNTIRGQRGAKGFAPVSDQRTGMVLAFATAAGDTASDEGAQSGPYAEALAAEIVKPGLTDQQVFNAVRAEVVRKTRTQTPWTHDGLIGDRVIFKTTGETMANASTPAVGKEQASAKLSEAALAWDRVRRSQSIPVIEAFVKQFPGTLYAAEAEELLAEQRRAAVERRRLALLQKSDEDRKSTTSAAASRGSSEDPAARSKAESNAKIVSEAVKRDPALSVTPGSGQSFRDCAECPEMVVVPAGSFTMGSSPQDIAALTREDPSLAFLWRPEGPQRKVTITKSFAVGRFEVTFTEWEACVAGGGCTGNSSPDDRGWGKAQRPVINVSWDDAKNYALWLSGKTGKGYRLLTEAEWEYSARSKSLSRFSFGDDASQLGAHAWYSLNSGGRSHPVGEKLPNAWGLHDMHGNVWEWVEDCWHESFDGAPSDGRAWTTACRDDRRVIRGGTWASEPRGARLSVRNSGPPKWLRGVGLRVARTL